MPGARRKHEPGAKDVPLPLVIPRSQQGGSEPAINRADVAFAHAFCPGHAGERRTALLLLGRHLVWKSHFVMYGLPGKEKPLPCRTSGVALCNELAMPKDGIMVLNQSKSARESDPMHGQRSARCLH